MIRNKFFLLFLLLGLLLGNAFAAEGGAPLEGKPLEQNEAISMELDGDSVEIYNDLIAEENYDSHYGPNIAGMVVGGLFTGAGGALTVFGVHAIMLSDSRTENFDDVANGVLGGYCLLLGVPLITVGIPVLSYNTYKFAVRKGHANRRDEYIDAFKRYKEKRESGSVEWLLVPSVDLANAGGGLNLLVAF